MLVVVAHRGQQVPDVMVVQGVVNVPSVAASPDQAQRPKDPQMVRGRAHAERDTPSELLDRPLAGNELGEDAEPSRRAQRLESLSQLVGLLGVERPRRRAVLGGMRHSVRVPI